MKKFLLALLFVTLFAQTALGAEHDSGEPVFQVSFSTGITDDASFRVRRGMAVQEIPYGGTAIPPVWTRSGWLLGGWDKELDNITEDAEITAQWLRLGAVTTGGTGDVTSADLVYLARYVAGHAGFEIQDYRIANLWGENRPPTFADVVLLSRWLTGYEIEELAPTRLPTIEVLTEFPHGSTYARGIDIEYTAESGIEGEHIVAVDVYHNGSLSRSATLYWAGFPDGYGHKIEGEGRGTLGQGWVPFIPGENRITIVAEDSFGMTAAYEVQNIPYGERVPSIDAPSPSREDFAPSVYKPDYDYVINRLYVFASCFEPILCHDIYAEAFLSVQGEIIGFWSGMNIYIIRVPDSDEDGLEAMGEYLIDTYPHLFDDFALDSSFWHNSIGVTNSTHEGGDYFDFGAASEDSFRAAGGFFHSSASSGSSFRTRDSWWGSVSDRAFRNIDLPRAWAVFGAHIRQNIKVAIIDDAIQYNHEYVQMPRSHLFRHANASGVRDHGTAVMSIIASPHNAGSFVGGVINISGSSLFGYDASYYDDEGKVNICSLAVFDALDEFVVRQRVPVINASIGGPLKTRTDPYNERGRPSYPQFNTRMNELLRLNRNFIIIHSAGNCIQQALYNGMFALVTDENSRRHIITVGSSTSDGNVAGHSNYGSRVDVLAPGVGIASATAGDSMIGRSGTSYAAPHVAGLAALIWSENPRLPPEDVIGIIISSARSHGRIITENRGDIISEEYRNHVYYEINAPAALFRANNYNPYDYMGCPRNPAILPTRTLVVGHVICDETEQSIGDIDVRLYRGETLLQSYRTTDYGFYRIFHAKNRQASRIVINARGYLPYEIDLSEFGAGIYERTHRLTLAQTVFIGAICDVTNIPVRGAVVTLSHGGESWTGITDARGRVAIGIPRIQGTFQLLITAEGRFEPFSGNPYMSMQRPDDLFFESRRMTPLDNPVRSTEIVMLIETAAMFVPADDLEEMKLFAQRIAESLSDNDRIAVAAIGPNMNTTFHNRLDGNAHKSEAVQRILNLTRFATGEGAVFSSLVAAIRHLNDFADPNSNRVIIILSSGHHAASGPIDWPAAFENAINNSDITIHSVITNTSPAIGRDRMSNFAARTGGVYVNLNQDDVLVRALR
jgi:hypothetical protein